MSQCTYFESDSSLKMPCVGIFVKLCSETKKKLCKPEQKEDIHDSMNFQELEFIAYIYILL